MDLCSDFLEEYSALVLVPIILASRPRCGGVMGPHTSYNQQSAPRNITIATSAGNTFNYDHDVMTDTPTLA